MNVDFNEDTYEGLPFATALSMAMMEKLDIRKMIDAESGKIDGGIYNLSTGMAAKSFIGSMTSEMGRTHLSYKGGIRHRTQGQDLRTLR